MNKFKIILASLITSMAFGATNPSPRCCISYNEDRDLCTLPLPSGYELALERASNSCFIGAGVCSVVGIGMTFATSMALSPLLPAAPALSTGAASGCTIGTCSCIGLWLNNDLIGIKKVNNEVRAMAPNLNSSSSNPQPDVIGAPVPVQMTEVQVELVPEAVLNPVESPNRVTTPRVAEWPQSQQTH